MSVRPVVSLAATALLGASVSVTAAGANPGEDLKATIVLHGFPCNQVVDSKRNADSDYSATCKDGNRYHITVDAQGRVVVKRL
ncbi:MAG: hypothetical protein JOY91_07920 [Sinobacteraceae bacterium]|nr:hypothetical protein [Nevskiaceae bacterium]